MGTHTLQHIYIFPLFVGDVVLQEDRIDNKKDFNPADWTQNSWSGDTLHSATHEDFNNEEWVKGQEKQWGM